MHSTIYDEFHTDEFVNRFGYAVLNNDVVKEPISSDQLTKTTSAEELYVDTDNATTTIECWDLSLYTITMDIEVLNDIMRLRQELERLPSRSERRGKGLNYEKTRYKRKRNNLKEYF